MAKIFASPVQNLIAGIAGPVKLGDASLLGGKVHALVKTIDLAAQAQIAVADIIVWGRLPKGAVPLVSFLDTSVTLATSTIDVGIEGTAAKFRAAAVLTTVDVPQPFMKAAALGVPLAASALVQSVVAVAALPAAGTLTMVMYYTTPHGG